MPTGPKGQKRPADAIARAVNAAPTSKGEDQEEAPEHGKDKAAQ